MDIEAIIGTMWHRFLTHHDPKIRALYGAAYAAMKNLYEATDGDEWWQSAEERQDFINEG